MKAVLDTNVLVSALFNTTTPPALIVDAWRVSRFELVLSSGSFGELEEVLDRGEIAPYIRRTGEWIEGFRHQLRDGGRFVEPVMVTVVTDDPDNDLILGTAIAGEADYIVTGDKHLLVLGVYRGIEILTPRRFLDLLGIADLLP